MSVTLSQTFQAPQLPIFLVVAKSYWNGRFRIIAFDGQQLFDMNVSHEYVTPGNAYRFQLVNSWDPTNVAAQSLAVQGAPIKVDMVLNDMFAALKNIASLSFLSIYPNIVIQEYKPFMNVGNIFQPPRAFLVQGNMIKKQRMNDCTTRCIINTDAGEIDIRYTGDGPDSYIGLPEYYDENLVLRHYTLILVVADPLSNHSWSGTRNYFLVVAIY